MDRNNIYFLLPTLLQEHGENISFAPVPEDVATWIKGERVALYADDKARQVQHEIAATPEVQALHEATAGVVHHEAVFEATLDQTRWGKTKKRELRALFHQHVARNIEQIIAEQMTDRTERKAASKVLAEHFTKAKTLGAERVSQDFVEGLLRQQVDAYYKCKK